MSNAKNSVSSGESGLSRRQVLHLAAGAAAPLGMGAFASSALASDYPTKPLKMVHAFAAGSSTDATGRMLADRLTQRLGQSVIVENKPGASMMIGTQYAARQPADGLTLVMVTVDSMQINPVLYKRPGYAVSDFDLVTMVGPLPGVLVAAPDFPYPTFVAARDAMLKEGKKFAYGTWGNGSVAHMVGEQLKLHAGMALEYVPFLGQAPSLNAVMGGHVHFALGSKQNSADMLKSGKAKVLAVQGDQRMAEMPDVPTFAEIGFPNIDGVQWHGVAVRAGGRQSVVDRLYREISAIMKEPDMQERLLKNGYSRVDGRSPKEFTAFVAQDAKKWHQLVKQTGLSLE